jgi:hypothetical protein
MKNDPSRTTEGLVRNNERFCESEEKITDRREEEKGE